MTYKAKSFFGFDGEIIDQKAPPHHIYFLNENYMDFRSIIKLSKWKRFKLWLKKLIKKY